MDYFNILLADDHPIFLEGIKTVLTVVKSAKIVAVAYTTDQLLQSAKEHLPNMVISDSVMPSADIIQTIGVLKEEVPEVKVLIIIEQQNEEHILKLLGAGIDGYILKEDAPEILVQAVQAIIQGGMWISPILIKQFVEVLVLPCNGRKTPYTQEKLSRRENEVLQLLAMGMENCEIADLLCITRRTVQNYVSTIYQKICVKSRSQAVLYAIKQGLVKC